MGSKLFIASYAMKKRLIIPSIVFAVASCIPSAPPAEKSETINATAVLSDNNNAVVLTECENRCKNDLGCLGLCNKEAELLPSGTYWEINVDQIFRTKGVGIVPAIPGETEVSFHINLTAHQRIKTKASLVKTTESVPIDLDEGAETVTSEAVSYESTYEVGAGTVAPVYVDPDEDRILAPSETDTKLIKAMILCRCLMPLSVRTAKEDGKELIRASAKELGLAIPIISGNDVTSRESPAVIDAKTLSYLTCEEMGYLTPSVDQHRKAGVDSDGKIFRQPYQVTVNDRLNVNVFNEKLDFIFKNSIYLQSFKTLEEITGPEGDITKFMSSPLGAIVHEHLPTLTVRYAAAGCTANNCPKCTEAAAVLSPLFQNPRNVFDSGNQIMIGKSFVFPSDEIFKNTGWRISELALVPQTMFSLILSKIEKQNPSIKKTFDIASGVGQLIKLYQIIDPFGQNEGTNESETTK